MRLNHLGKDGVGGMKTEVKLIRGTRETVYEVDLPHIPEGATIHTPEKSHCRVALSSIDISLVSGPTQILVVR